VKKSELITVAGVLLILIIGISLAYQYTQPPKKLKIYNPADLNPALVDISKRDVTQMHRIADFALTNQNGSIISQKNFEGKIYVADFFFTTCQSICPIMTGQMSQIYDQFKENSDVMLLSHTVMPEVDSVPVLAKYAQKHKADALKWMFVTGDKKQLYELARKSYFAVLSEGTGDEHDFIHTENFILIDKEKRIRGFYDGTSEEDVDRLIEEIEILLAEYDE